MFSIATRHLVQRSASQMIQARQGAGVVLNRGVSSAPKGPLTAGFFQKAATSRTLLQRQPGMTNRANLNAWKQPAPVFVARRSMQTGGRAYARDVTQVPSLSYLAVGGSALGLGGLYVYGMTAASTRQTYAQYVRERIRGAYSYVAAGLGISAASATAFWKSGIAFRINPMLMMIGSFIGVIGCNFALHSISPDNVLAKNLTFAALTSLVGFSLCPMGMMGGPLLLKAAAATAAVVGSLTMVAGAAPSDAFLQLGGPLALGFGLVFAAGLGSMFFPASALLHNVCLYGGLAVFGGFTLYDTQRIVAKAKVAPYWDSANESVALYLNFINLFVRIAQIMFMNQRRK